MEDFVKKVLESPETFGGFNIKSYERDKYRKPEENVFYGVAVDRIGMTYVKWCTRGHSCNYFGHPIEENMAMEIRKDGDTRHAFNGYVFNEEDVHRVLKLTW